MTRAELRLRLALVLAALSGVVGYAVGALVTPTVERTTVLACDGETFVLEQRRALLERLP